MASELGRILESSWRVLRTEGLSTFLSKAFHYSRGALGARIEAFQSGAILSDVVIFHAASPQHQSRAEELSEELRMNGWAVLLKSVALSSSGTVSASELSPADAFDPADARLGSVIIMIGLETAEDLRGIRERARHYQHPVVVDIFEGDSTSDPKIPRLEALGAALFLAPDEKFASRLLAAGIPAHIHPRAQLDGAMTTKSLVSSAPKSPSESSTTQPPTVALGSKISRILFALRRPSIGFMLPSTNVSGGVNVVMGHARALQLAGYDVTVLSTADEPSREVNFRGTRLSVVALRTLPSKRSFDVLVATFFTTVAEVLRYPNAFHKMYLVQGYETDFLEPGHPLRIEAEGTYSPLLPIKRVTVSAWCQRWLKERYQSDAPLIPNCICREQFPFSKRSFSGKIRVLIEGDPSNHYKNVDESFKIANQLDRSVYEVWFLSTNAKPKDWYRCDRVLQRIPYDQVSEVYRDCHILLKTSLLESFSYPPLEMMASGGFVVAIQNFGNAEYLKHGENCLLFSSGDGADALKQIELIRSDAAIRERLEVGGQKTASSRADTSLLPILEAVYFGRAKELRAHREDQRAAPRN